MSIVPKPDSKSRRDQTREKGELILQWVNEPKDQGEFAESVESVHKKLGEIKFRY